MRDRITGLRRVPAADLRENPKNWRTHPPEQRTALAAALDSIGLVDAVIARDTPDGLELVDGHLRADLAGDADIPVLVVDLDDAEAAAALATLDPIGALAVADLDRLADLVDGLAAPPMDYSALYGPLHVPPEPPEPPEPTAAPAGAEDEGGDKQPAFGRGKPGLSVSPRRLPTGNPDDQRSYLIHFGRTIRLSDRVAAWLGDDPPAVLEAAAPE